MNMPTPPDPFAILSGDTAPNGYYLCLATTDITQIEFIELNTLQEVDTSGYQRIPITFDVQEASDNSNLVATCNNWIDSNGDSHYLDFTCGDNGVDVEINSVYILASFDDQDYLLFVQNLPSPQYFNDAESTVRVPQITLLADTWTSAA